MTRDLILTFNTGSSTIKLGFYALEAAAPRPLASGVIDFRDEPFEVRLTREGKTFSGPITADPGDLTAVLNQAFEPGGQDVARHAQIVLPLFEPADAVEGVANDQQGPGIADHLKRGGDGAALAAVVGGASHGPKVTPRQRIGNRVANPNGVGQSCFATDQRPSRLAILVP